ncbi:MAG: 2'-5' RNA ligase family protein, partial [Bacteroidetes bacterium]
ITLQAPFRFSLKKIKTLKTTLADFARHRAPFEVRLRGWDHFADRVIFIDVEPNEYMSDLQYSLTTLLHEKFAIPKDRRPWHPHMTVAFKDLLPARFPRAWAYFSDISFARDFVPAGLTLLLHRDGRWHVFDTFEWGKH